MATPPLPQTYTSLTYTRPHSRPTLAHAPLSAPGPSQILVKLHAAAINPIDVQIWGSGLVGLVAGHRAKGIGCDYAGTIVRVGSAVRGEGRWKEGDEVFGLLFRVMGPGTFGQYALVEASDPMARKPGCWSWEQAAAVPLCALTGFAVLEWLPPDERKGEERRRRIVVAGASGGAGGWVVQLAKKLYNCHVTGICSGTNADFVRRLGADEVVDYTSQGVTQTLLDSVEKDGKFDLYVDCVGGTEVFGHWTSLLHSDGAYVTIVGDKTSRTTVGGSLTYLTSPAQVFRYLFGLVRGPRYAVVEFREKSEWLQEVANLAENGELEVTVQEVIRDVLKEGSEAWRRVFDLMEEGRVRGKIVVSID